MKREYEILLKVYNGISYGEIDSWSGLVHDWNLKVTGGVIKVTATREELDLLLDKLYADETNYKVIGIHYSDDELKRLRNKPFTFVDETEKYKDFFAKY